MESHGVEMDKTGFQPNNLGNFKEPTPSIGFFSELIYNLLYVFKAN